MKKHNGIKLAAIEARWKNSASLWVHGPSARADIVWLVAEIKRLANEKSREKLLADLQRSV